MKARALIVTAVLLFILSIPLHAQDTPLTKPPSTSPGVTRNLTAPAKKSRLPDKIYDMAAGAVSGDRVRCPRRIIARNLNTLRYNYTLSRVVSITPSVDLWSKLLNVSAVEMVKVPTVTPTTDRHIIATPPEDELKKRVVENRIELEKLLGQVQNAIANVKSAGQLLKGKLQANSAAPNGILQDITDLLRKAPKSLFLVGTEAIWADASSVEKVATEAENLKIDLDKKKPSTLLEYAVKENEKILAAIPDLKAGSAKHSAFIEAREKLLDWKSRMEGLQTRWHDYQSAVKTNSDRELHPDPFAIEAEADCEFAFGGTKNTTITITRMDQLPDSNTPSEQVLSVVGECSSPFTVSAGVVFSTVPQQEFAIRPVTSASGGAPVNTFVTTSDSHFHPLPLGMIHVRIYEPTETYAFHASLGLSGNFRSQSEGGSDVEFLFGLSVSLFRTMFITPGLYLGRRVELSSGFNEGAPVPTGITEPPLKKSYQPGFGLAITFTKP